MNIDYLKLLESYLLTVILALPLRNKIVKPSDFLGVVFLAAAIIPTLSFYALNSKERLFMYYMAIAYLIVIYSARLFPGIRFRYIKQGNKIMIFFGSLLVLFVLALMIKNGGLNYFNLDLTRVYEYRGEVSRVINMGILGYLNTWVFKVINPALMVWALLRNKKKLLILFISIQVLFFGISSHKSVLFYPFLILGVYYLFNSRYYKKITSYMFLGLSFLVIICGLFAIWWEQIWPATLFIRRVFYVPALLNFTYYEVFSQLGHVYLSNSIFALLVDYPFSYDYTRIISLHLFGHPNTNCNNGFLATSYMHFGLGGVVVYSVIVGLLLWMVDSLSFKRLPVWVAISISIVPFFSLFTSADLTTALLTHGIMVVLILLWLLGRKENKTVIEGDKLE